MINEIDASRPVWARIARLPMPSSIPPKPRSLQRIPCLMHGESKMIRKNQEFKVKFLTVLVVVFVFANIAIGLAGARSEILLPFLAVSLGVFIFLHGGTRYGIRNILVMIGTGMAVSLFYEALSIATGFPYSGYHYTAILGPQLLGFPILVMFGYGVIAYVFWTVAGAITGNNDNKLKGANVVLVPVISAALFTSWDFVFDPILASINQAYIWDNPGGYFGIPFANFTGWYLATYTIFQIFAIFIRRQKIPQVLSVNMKVYGYQAIIVYASVFIQLPILMVFEVNEEITIASGQVLQTMEIYQSMTLVGIAAILVPAIIAFTKVYNAKELG